MAQQGLSQLFMDRKNVHLWMRYDVVRYIGFDCSISSQPGLYFHLRRFEKQKEHLSGYFVELGNCFYTSNITEEGSFFFPMEGRDSSKME